MFAGGHVVLHVGQAEAAAPLVIPILHNRHRDSRNVRVSHELRDGRLNLSPFFLGEFVFLGLRSSRAQNAQNNEGCDDSVKRRAYVRAKVLHARS